ncbi:hypothetical protein [Chitinophaga nivalis]|uniref:DUF4303 domain-containing protein n=1 Tax=Chitinophaga nivalis TaxID=2991709 RepID=A0ABT3IPH8_9BACT|nr:hypothetical protein [Chitinophaga nivalis]MCW3464513.1 hypothetical protein [Chitinophaga nivalis]MCW3485796.1 hypothetical protein [Chitinophaga nivalis]
MNLYTDIKESVESAFAFLKAAGFTDFEEQQIAFETHFEAKNEYVKVDVWFEFIYSTPIWVTINGYHIQLLEPEHPLFEQYARTLQELYEPPADNTTKDACGIDYLGEQYEQGGRQLNHTYLEGMARLLQSYPAVLQGELDVLVSHAATAAAAWEAEQAAEKIAQQLYTCTFSIDDLVECEATGTSLDEIRTALKEYEADRICVLQVVDPYMNPVAFEWPLPGKS